jgi:hypothetical protein
MCNKIDINEINRIPKDEFTIMLKNWMEDETVKKACEGQLRNNLIQQFLSKTALGNKMKKTNFDPKSQVMNSMEAEHLYCNKYYFTLSVFSTESQQQIPNFEGGEKFRFEKHEIKEFLNILGFMKDDAVVKHIINIYNSSGSQSLLSILIKQLISSHKKVAVECRTTATQTEFVIEEAEKDDNAKIVDLSQISCRSKSRRSKRKNHSLATPTTIPPTAVTPRKSKKSKGVSKIAQSLDLMSQNINLITNKLEDFQKSPSHDDSKSIIVGTVGTIMQQLNGCVKNFERLCDDIKALNDVKLPKNYDEWCDDMKHSENGRKFLKKFTKSFTRIIEEERAKIKKDYQRKFEKEKRKLARFHQMSSKKLNQPESKISKDIHEIYESTVLKLKYIEDENKIFEKKIGVDENTLKPEGIQKKVESMENLDMNKCRQIHSKESSSINTNPHSYSSASFEDISEVNI